ncbi:XapX domain-containing protein [Pseudoxanthomonas sp. PXM01]|uniref:XapX domain-containing protein n=1 Tax=Pseudoxanthomonas sp. PXM01 TaxID=2769295 RepID=UPI001784CA4F|nr:XapX domain-containing protein [Pseudoxanthomonas sp. PXM01]MBD9469622.1 XapX domain-containing protein [Pseudoxanthomonas sp. PXM01]
MNVKFVAGLLLGFGIGFGCRAFGVPVPAPPVLVGALLVVAMTSGYMLADRVLVRREAQHRRDCGGPTGRTPRSDAP